MARRRRGRALRRRYGRAGYRIGPGGLEQTATAHLVPGHVYAMGASSSPSLVEIISVTDDRIIYRPRTKYGDTSQKVIERWIGEDLIARGEATFRSRYGASANEWVTMTEDQRHALLKGRM